ncbi:hypothetical protein EVAR_23932_1 [Eumeta japonica]|uniref:Uncharacterized protein n=1 Tax=Eumeta variegata TaxID=151549 RepID=A0A4C1V185_EUMVA|nr:hypothetical protein EVAR_23932_1 [Eumeta japonica]
MEESVTTYFFICSAVLCSDGFGTLQMFLPIVLISGICLYLSFWWKRRRMVELSKDVPSWSTCLPLLGHAHRFIGDNASDIFKLDPLSIRDLFVPQLLYHAAKYVLNSFRFKLSSPPLDSVHESFAHGDDYPPKIDISVLATVLELFAPIATLENSILL